jgi:cytochrome P450 / NADPH-cytochrome P450 reductase
LTVGLVEGPALSGRGTYRGTCSTFLAARRADDQMFVKIKRPGPGFSLPTDPTTPVIMICAGTGIAPFRGFLQELAARHDTGEELAPVVLVRGCQRSDHDHIYADEVQGWVDQGWLTYLQAFSREPGQPPQHVEDVIRQSGSNLSDLMRAGAKVLVCGDSTTFYDDVEQTVVELRATNNDVPLSEAQQWLQELKSDGLYVEDIWAHTAEPAAASN